MISAVINLFYIYDPWIMHVIRMAFIVGGVSVLFLAYQWYRRKITDIAFPLDSVLVILALIILSAIPLFVHGTQDISVLLMYVKSLILFIFGIAIYNVFYRMNSQANQAKLVDDLKIGVLIQAIMGVLALTGISIFIDMALGTNANYFLPRFQGSEQEYRLYNITSSAFFQLSAFYLVLLHFLLAYNAKHNSIPTIFIFLMLFIGLISGRTFFVFSLFSVLFYFKWRYYNYVLLFILAVVSFAYFLPENKYVGHALEPVVNLFSQKIQEFSSSTTNLVQNHLFIPNLKQLMIGDGYYFTEDGRYYGGSDSGFIRQALYGGMGYILLCFLFTVYFVKRVADNWFEGSWKFIISTVGLLSILNIKADIYAYPGIMFVLLMFLSLFGNKGKIITLFNR
ncbi:Membrane protein [[Haemophilus] ducreyi]|nr:hypothetical protein SAMN02983000_0240 [[Haemophilus] ducreyi]VEG83968.1 Membrane protein [[Haemophilus] ducreyi]